MKEWVNVMLGLLYCTVLYQTVIKNKKWNLAPVQACEGCPDQQSDEKSLKKDESEVKSKSGRGCESVWWITSVVPWQKKTTLQMQKGWDKADYMSHGVDSRNKVLHTNRSKLLFVIRQTVVEEVQTGRWTETKVCLW